MDSRCLVCNAPALYPIQFCSKDCEEDYNNAMEELSNLRNEWDEEPVYNETADEYRRIREDNLK